MNIKSQDKFLKFHKIKLRESLLLNNPEKAEYHNWVVTTLSRMKAFEERTRFLFKGKVGGNIQKWISTTFAVMFVIQLQD